MYSRSNHQKDETVENSRIQAWPFSPFTAAGLDEHEKSLAPYATVLDGFVESGSFLGH